jgi:hypothetical protein
MRSPDFVLEVVATMKKTATLHGHRRKNSGWDHPGTGYRENISPN